METRRVAIMQPKDNHDQQQRYDNEVDHGQSGCS